ncbi:hypothetical protein K2173_024233 [Erythroxylum novogranatense]|uniref:Spindle and kinetochore-associated protein 3 n=1 Tax=Erythroxylum novogranatense TaxID=1862640 RepID=A0AAV8UFM9_9ROSI|nr:hypothetical protein K2173_024233 [Erythroxylum novogranatense]
MEDSISAFSKTLSSFCNHLQSSSDALHLSVHRRPIPLDSASSTFIHSLNRRVSAASADLNLLDSLSFGTVSFEELLGHCHEVFKHNQNLLHHIRLDLNQDEVDLDHEDERLTLDLDSEDGCGRDYAAGSILLEQDLLMDDSLSLKSLGLSDVCLATLACEGEVGYTDGSTSEALEDRSDRIYNIERIDVTVAISPQLLEGEIGGDSKSVEVLRPIIEISKDDYENLPSYMQNLTPWEDLITAVEKINSSLRKKEKRKEGIYFHQDEIGSLGLGPKARTYLLLLMRMNQLVVETIDGLITYKVCSRHT